MPLSALVDSELLCAPLLSEQRWASLKGKHVLLQPCGHPGFGRVSPLGTQHFVHERDSGCEHRESAEHLHLKAVVARAAAHAGWQAGTEVAGDGFVADVLATRGQRQVAFEVQRSRQVLREYQQRQQRYLQHGIRCVWLARSVPAGYVVNPQLPLFVVRDWQREPRAVVVGREWVIADVVAALLSGRFRWQESVATQRVTSDVLRLLCPACGTSREVVVARWRSGACHCGLPVVRQQPNPGWCDRSRCCGYWGPALTLGRTSRSQFADEPVELGHWCVHALPAGERISA